MHRSDKFDTEFGKEESNVSENHPINSDKSEDCYGY